MEYGNLNIEVESMKRVDVITIAGRIDSSNASHLDQTFESVMGNGRHNIVLELSQVDYMSSAGLRAMVATLRECKKHRGDVRLASVSDRVSEVMGLSGLDSLFTNYDDKASAVGSF